MESQYIYWRNTGIAYEFRLNKYSYPNKTLASYVEGKSKQSKGSCMVRGYWGDIVNSPFISYGVKLYLKEENDYFYRKNELQYYHVYK